MIRIASPLFAVVFITNIANANEVSVGPVKLTLTTPPGACEMTDTDKDDRRRLTLIRGMLEKSGNALLADYTTCEQQKAWRTIKGALLKNAWQYQFVISEAKDGIAGTPSELIKTRCTQLREEGDKASAKNETEIRARTTELVKKAEFTGQGFLGVFEETPQACYAGMLQKFTTDSGVQMQQISVFATVVVHNREIIYYQVSPYDGTASITAAVESFKPLVNQFLAANR